MAVEFENLPNFRQVGGIGLTNKHGQKVRDGLLYRSSRTDFITVKDKGLFQELGIRTIFDLRRQSEYERSDGEKRLNDVYKTMLLKNGEVTDLKPSFRWGSKNYGNGVVSNPLGQRYLVNLWTMDLIWHIFYQLNFIIRWLSLLLLVVDWVLGSHFFVKFYNAKVLNRHPLSSQYFDVLEYCKPTIADILRQLLQPDCLPALIHCAHGKDRTGLIVAILLGCLEVEDDIIAEDYAKSEDGLKPIKQRVYEEIVERYGFKEECTGANAQTMKEVLHELKEKYGTVSNYLLSARFSLDEQAQLKRLFLQL